MKTVGDIIYKENEVSDLKLFLVWIGLLLLLVLTWKIAYVPLGSFNLLAALAIGVGKAGLVLWYFMRLRSSPRLVLLLFGASLVMLGIAALLTFADYLTR